MSLEWIFLVLPSLGIMKQCTKDYCTRRILLLLRAADRMSFIFKMNPMFFSNMGTICGSTWQPAAMGLTIQCTHNTFCGAKIRHIAFNDKAGYYFKLDLTWTPSFLHVMHFNHITIPCTCHRKWHTNLGVVFGFPLITCATYGAADISSTFYNNCNRDYDANSSFMTTANFHKEDNEISNTLRCRHGENIQLNPVLMCSFIF